MTALLTDEICQAVHKSVLCWFATVSDDGVPGVSPKEIFAVVDDLLIIANIKSPNSASNVAVNSNVCVAFVDIFVQKGFQVFGTANLVKSTDAEFERLAAPLLEMTQGQFPFATVFEVTPTMVKEIVAPRYLLYPETTESDQISSALETYGITGRHSIE